MSQNKSAKPFSYPVMLKLENKPCVIVGAGPVALRKLISLGQSGASLTVIAPEFSEEFRAKANLYSAQLIEALYQPEMLKGAFITIAATDDFAVNRQITEASPGLCNNITEPELGNFTVPATLTQGDITATIATAGVPAYTRLLKKHLEAKITPEHAAFLNFLREVRAELKTIPSTPKERTAFWRNTLNENILKLLEDGNLSGAKEIVLNAVTSFRTKS